MQRRFLVRVITKYMLKSALSRITKGDVELESIGLNSLG